MGQRGDFEIRATKQFAHLRACKPADCVDGDVVAGTQPIVGGQIEHQLAARLEYARHLHYGGACIGDRRMADHVQ